MVSAIVVISIDGICIEIMSGLYIFWTFPLCEIRIAPDFPYLMIRGQ